ncbi:MAG: 2-oxoacid:ferredoxin oxidoreductase subunit beta [Gammaproteobacteria bacterium]|nr:2-oxoacid:ferredoxin oxidoreductase subunit beta [Gammaproteobacteria bacterium]NNK99399.1 2-oxoacid:ferredoxin oxidoreductase subunit beta [Xanthomonadales bacterium]
MTNDKIALQLQPKEYKSAVKPVWCPGCGDFGVLGALTKALAGLKIQPEDAAVISGIGCSSRMPTYLSTYGFHGVHGRALAVATGLKVARPDLTVIATGGDGDGFSIGGNHFLHTCRRNPDLTYIVMDNQVYGMTKGQASPTTEPNWERAKLTPSGTGINPFQPLAIALASGANFIARCSSSDSNGTARVLMEAIRHPGFSMVQVLSPCVTFRPEQREWKRSLIPAPEDMQRTPDPAEAARLLMTDEGVYTGILYVGDRPVYQPKLKSEIDNIATLDEEFRL